jgi:hypothetical protein
LRFFALRFSAFTTTGGDGHGRRELVPAGAEHGGRVEPVVEGEASARALAEPIISQADPARFSAK